MAETDKSRMQRKSKRANVRFSDDEFERVLRESDVTGLSIPALLKDSHFRKREIVPLMHPTDQKSVARNASLILEEVKSLRDRMPTLPLSEVETLVREMSERIHALFLFVTGTYGNR